MDKSRKIRILLMSLSYMYKYGEAFVDLLKDSSQEESAKAWKILREQIKAVHSELKEKLDGEARAQP
jgi:hypothetical protein